MIKRAQKSQLLDKFYEIGGKYAFATVDLSRPPWQALGMKLKHLSHVSPIVSAFAFLDDDNDITL